MKYLCQNCNSIWTEEEINGECRACGSFELLLIEKDYKKTIVELRSMLRKAKKIQDQELIELITNKINKLGKLKVKRDVKTKTTMQILEKINHDLEHHVPEEPFSVYQIRFDEIKKRLADYVEIEEKYKDLKETVESSVSTIARNKEQLNVKEINTGHFVVNIYNLQEELQNKLGELNN